MTMAPYNDRVLDAGRAGPTPEVTDRSAAEVNSAAQHSPAPDFDRLLALTLSRPTEALAEADRLLTIEADGLAASVAHQARAIVFRDRGRVTEAISELRLALLLARTLAAPDRAIDVQATLGVTLALAGQTAAGLAELDQAVTG